MSTQTAFNPLQAAADNITYWAYQAGFRGPSLTRIVAYGLAESGGDPHAHNNTPQTGDDSYGVWQINYFGDLRQPRTQRYGDPASLYDPVANAKAAYDLSGGGKDFSPWKSDDQNGRYAQSLPYAQAATSGLGGAMPGTPPVDPGGFLATPVSTKNDCLLSFPSVGPVGGGCIFHESQGRAVLGALILAGGVLVGGLGVVLLMGKSVGSVTQYLPNPVGMVAGRLEDRQLRAKRAIGPQNQSERDAQHWDARRSMYRSVRMDDVQEEPFS